MVDPSSGSRATMRIVLEHWFDVLDAANLDEARHILLARPVHVVLISAVMLLNSASPAKDGFITWLHEAEASTRRRRAA